MIVVDSSVWIDNFKDIHAAHVRKLEAIRNPREIVVGDLILFEVLQGARDDQHAERMHSHLRKFPQASFLNTEMAPHVARNFRILRQAGVTIRKSIDLIIATYCIEHGHLLLHNDRDFAVMEKHLGLRVL